MICSFILRVWEFMFFFYIYIAVGLLPMPVCMHPEATGVLKRETYRPTSSRWSQIHMDGQIWFHQDDWWGGIYIYIYLKLVNKFFSSHKSHIWCRLCFVGIIRWKNTEKTTRWWSFTEHLCWERPCLHLKRRVNPKTVWRSKAEGYFSLFFFWFWKSEKRLDFKFNLISGSSHIHVQVFALMCLFFTIKWEGETRKGKENLVLVRGVVEWEVNESKALGIFFWG